ncbi:MAG: hypothetical protein IKF82_01265 [Bacilli bacterium]|nr:hypothetical protein [Bacilli bacterium]
MMSETKENKVSKAVYENKLSKYGVTKKTIYSVSGMLICIFLIIILSITQAQFNTDLITTVPFWIDFAILTGLCIYGMISGQQTGDDTARNNPNGLFRTSLNKYALLFNKIDALMLFAYFDEWLEFYRERKLRKKTESVLKDNGIHQMEVLDLDLLEIENLKSPYKKEWSDGRKDTYFLSYTEEQIGIIRYCLEGNVKVSKLPRTFFVDAFYHSEKDMWESAANSTKKKSAFLSANYLYRIMTLLVLSILSAGLVPGMGDDASSATVWLSLAKRVFCVTTAFIWGIFIGFEVVKIDVAYIDFKRDVLNQYHQEYELKVYVPHTLEEKAKELYEKEHSQEVIKNGAEQEDILG